MGNRLQSGIDPKDGTNLTTWTISEMTVLFTSQKRRRLKAVKSSHLTGFTLLEIMIVVGVVGLLAAVAIPNYVRVRGSTQANACINNMHQIDGAVTEWALENGKKTGDPAPDLTADLMPYIRLNSSSGIPSCPAGGTYTMNLVGIVPQVACSLGTSVNPPHILR